MGTYHPEREIDNTFLERVADWLTHHGEVLVVLRYLAAAGSKDFALCRTMAEIEQLIGWASIGTDIVVFREPHLPMRGTVTDDFIEKALRGIPEGGEYLILSSEREQWNSSCRVYREGDTHSDLREHLAEFFGHEVALGDFPNYVVDDHEGMISRSKGGIDGPR